jgi:hypothetical protein
MRGMIRQSSVLVIVAKLFKTLLSYRWYHFRRLVLVEQIEQSSDKDNINQVKVTKALA